MRLMIPTRESLQDRANVAGIDTFLGCEVGEFERGGRKQLAFLLEQGLSPSSRLLDVGCGALRIGYWAMRLLDPGHYFGIEPNVAMRNVGLSMVEDEVLERAKPQFSENEDFDFSVFGEQFEFVFASSIWTHASTEQIQAMLASFAVSATPDGVFLTSYHPVSSVWRQLSVRYPRSAHELAVRVPLTELSPYIARLPAKDPAGDGWAGRSHVSKTGGKHKRSLSWIAKEAAQHDLIAELMPHRIGTGQSWLRIRRG
jgi:hypothetical protein